MKNIGKTLLFLFTTSMFGQNSITFSVEELSKPKEIIKLTSTDDIFKNLILGDASLSQNELERNNIDFDFGMLAKSNAPDSLVDYGYHSFFNGMYRAFADHRPFVLSPDMIWLLIGQGFARHVNANPESLRSHFVDFSEKESLLVMAQKDMLANPQEWENVFPQFTEQIAKRIGNYLANVLRADFSTTTSAEKMASEITILETMTPYFEYVVMRIICGIPEITLMGTTEDWQKILDKTKYLGKYDLDWWIKELEPVLEEFVKASKGEIDKEFWRNMFKQKSEKTCGTPEIFDGWIVKFYPYDNNGERFNLKEITYGNNMPNEIVKVDVKYIELFDDGKSKETILEFWSGFIGLEQNPDNFALKPKIGWMIKEKDVNLEAFEKKLDLKMKNPRGIQEFDILNFRIHEVPESLKGIPSIFSLRLEFIDTVFIPEWFKDIRIHKLEINGRISKTEYEKIVKWFPDSFLIINGKDSNFDNGMMDTKKE